MSDTPKVYSAVAAVQLAMSKEGISKGRKNQQQGYAFRGIDDVYAALAPHLAANGLCIIPRVTARETVERQTKAGGALFYTSLTVEFDFVAVADGSKHTACTIGEAMDSGDKSSNKAMSAAYKYACFLTFAIPTEGENDADEVTHPTIAPKTPARTMPEPVSRPAAPPSERLEGDPADWRTCPVPAFIKGKGDTVGDMKENDLKWWHANYTPKPFKGAIAQGDIDFRDALDAAAAELGF